MLLAHTCLESNAPINLTCVGLDGRPVQKSLRQMVEEWIAFRQQCITRRTRHRLQEVLDQTVAMNCDICQYRLHVSHHHHHHHH